MDYDRPVSKQHITEFLEGKNCHFIEVIRSSSSRNGDIPVDSKVIYICKEHRANGNNVREYRDLITLNHPCQKCSHVKTTVDILNKNFGTDAKTVTEVYKALKYTIISAWDEIGHEINPNDASQMSKISYVCDGCGVANNGHAIPTKMKAVVDNPNCRHCQIKDKRLIISASRVVKIMDIVGTASVIDDENGGTCKFIRAFKEESAAGKAVEKVEFLCSCGNPEPAIVLFTSFYGKKILQRCKKCTARRRGDCNEKRYGARDIGASKQIREKIKATNKAKTGHEELFRSPEHREKMRANMEKKYGTKNARQNAEINAKANKTLVEKYGFTSAAKNADVEKKRHETCMTKYGVTSTAMTSEVKDKIAATNIEKHGEKSNLCGKYRDDLKKEWNEKWGVDNPMKNPEIKNSQNKAVEKKYGVDTVLKDPKTREQIKATCIKKYGCEYPLQNAEIAERQMKTAYGGKEYTMPSGEIRRVQGYETFYLDEILKTEDESDIFSDRIDMPEIWYLYNGNYKRYYPDFWIKSKNLLVEIKSDYTMTIEPEKIMQKKKACQYLGYDFEIRIYSEKGVLLKTL